MNDIHSNAFTKRASLVQSLYQFFSVFVCVKIGQASSVSCWQNGFEHNKLAILELKLQWVPQTLFGGSTWECVFLHEEMKIIY